MASKTDKTIAPPHVGTPVVYIASLITREIEKRTDDGGDEVEEYVTRNHDVERAALVTGVHIDGSVNLVYFADAVGTAFASNVPEGTVAGCFKRLF